MKEILNTNIDSAHADKKVKKTCGWCEVETFVKESTLICPNCNKQGY